VGKTRHVVVASPKYLARRKRPQSPGDIASHDIIPFTGLTPTPEWRFSQDGQRSHVWFPPTFVTNSADAALGHAERGRGLPMLLAYQVMESVRAGRLKVLLSRFEPPPLPIHFVYPTTRLLSGKVRAFVELAVETCDWRFIEL
jgi:DNA-binding transcriptional LysR family regulator